MEWAEVELWAKGMVIKAREALSRIGSELRDRLAAETDPVECERLVESEIRRALDELASNAARMM